MPANIIYKPVADLPRIRKSQHGGLCRVRFIPVEDVITIPPAGLTTAVVDDGIGIILKAGKAWLTAYGPVRRGLRCETKRGDDGPYVESTVTASLPFNGRPSHLILDKMKYHKYILLVDRADGVLIIGSLDNPATFSFISESGEVPRDSAGTSIRFVWISEDQPLFYIPG